jgi:CheY-like chemotaxis protein
LDTDLPPVAHEYLELVKVSSDNLLGVINDILDFSKIDAGKMALESTPFELSARMGKLLKTLAFQAHKKRIEIVCDFDPAIPQVLLGDSTRLTQVMTNLVGNAIKFTEEGEIVVAARLTTIEEGWATIHFSVSDTGIGIESDKLESIFESFTQADGSTTRKYGGTGLGLAISNRLIQLMGGAIHVESSPGNGSVFSFEVRLEGSSIPPESRLDAASLQGVRVLIVDDHPTNRKVLLGYASRMGMEATAATGVAQALRVAREASRVGSPFQIVFSDYHMPEKNGFDLVAAMRNDPTLSLLPVVMLTSVDHIDFARSASELNISGHLTKPVDPSELRDAALRVLKRMPKQEPVQVARPEAVSPLRILAAEDSRVNQLVLIRMLEKLGHEVIVVENGRDAVGAALAGSYDLILMDCQMPEMDGFDATRRIRQDEKNTLKHTPIIALTAYAMAGDRERCQDAGMDDYLAKPIDRNQLLSKLAAIRAPAERDAVKIG